MRSVHKALYLTSCDTQVVHYYFSHYFIFVFRCMDHDYISTQQNEIHFSHKAVDTDGVSLYEFSVDVWRSRQRFHWCHVDKLVMSFTLGSCSIARRREHNNVSWRQKVVDLRVVANQHRVAGCRWLMFHVWYDCWFITTTQIPIILATRMTMENVLFWARARIWDL